MSEYFQAKKPSMNRSKRPVPLTCSTQLDSPSYWPTSLWLSKLEPPLSTPPLSPARSPRTRKFASDDDDDEPLSLLSAALKNKMNLLSDEEEEGDDELIPIARLNDAPLLSAAEKYKAKVKAMLQLDAYEL